MEKAVMWEHEELMVYGALSGRLDHTLANLQLVRQVLRTRPARDRHRRRASPCACSPGSGRLRPAGRAGCGDGCRWFAANDVAKGVIERGLEYSLDDEALTNRTSRGLSNELTGEQATIAVEEGTLYVFYPLG